MCSVDFIVIGRESSCKLVNMGDMYRYVECENGGEDDVKGDPKDGDADKGDGKGENKGDGKGGDKDKDKER